jgi:FkbM family methyltransferase
MTTLPAVTPGEMTEDLLQRLIGKRDPVILDIGCNDGTHTRWFLELFSEARVYCFEPDPRPRERFKAAIASDRAVLYDYALAAKDGESEFHVSSGRCPDPRADQFFVKDWDYSGSIRRPKKHLDDFPWVKFERCVTVKTCRLDTWALTEHIDHVDFIWADVQGAEADLIMGGSATLQKTRFFYTEYSNDEWYEGQLDLAGITALLPRFEVVCRYEFDVLFRNKDLT